MKIIGRCKGRMVIAPEHCLSYQGKKERDVNRLMVAHDHCKSDIKHGL